MVKKYLLLAQVLCLVMVILPNSTYALESSIQLHKVDQSNSYGYSFSLGDEIFKSQAYTWQANYNRFENVSINNLDEISEEWDRADFDFTFHTIDLMLGYRFHPRSYDKFINTFMIELQLGATVNLTEHKLVFRPELDRDDIYFANQGDINPVISLLLQKSFTRNSAVHFGFKYYPDFSDFGNISTLFIGYNYRFGRQTGY